MPQGFLRAANGTFTVFDAPDSTGTFALSINAAGTITGYYVNASNVKQGFVRAADGTFTTIIPTGATSEIVPTSINSAGALAGSYGNSSPRLRGFMRSAAGSYTEFDVKGAVGPPGGTEPTSINTAGQITGYYTLKSDSRSANGFLRTP